MNFTLAKKFNTRFIFVPFLSSSLFPPPQLNQPFSRVKVEYSTEFELVPKLVQPNWKVKVGSTVYGLLTARAPCSHKLDDHMNLEPYILPVQLAADSFSSSEEELGDYSLDHQISNALPAAALHNRGKACVTSFLFDSIRSTIFTLSLPSDNIQLTMEDPMLKYLSFSQNCQLFYLDLVKKHIGNSITRIHQHKCFTQECK